MKIIRKCFEIKAADLEEEGSGSIKGPANVIGILDRGRDVVFPGFFRKALAGFRKNGFVSQAHDWNTWIAMPTRAEEKGNQLYTEADFHSTEDAQAVRTKCRERMQRGLSVGLSVGFMPDYENGVMVFESGKALLDYAASIGCDMSLFDTKGIKAHKGRCRGLLPDGCHELYEYGIVPVPMNQASLATEAKSGEAEEESDVEVPETKYYYYDEPDYDPFEDVEEEMTLSALDSLFWALRVCVYRCVRSDEGTLEERTERLSGEFSTFSEKALAVISALMALGEDEKAAIVADLKQACVRAGEDEPRLADKIAAIVKTSETPQEFERRIRQDLRMSRKQAVALAAGYYKNADSPQSDSEAESEPDSKTVENLQSDSASGETDTGAREREERARALRLKHLRLREFSLKAAVTA